MKHIIKDILKSFLSEDKKKWTKDMVHKIALDYKTKTEFNKHAKGAYGAAKKYGWFDDVTSHMVSPQIRWTKEMISSEAKKYKTKEGFRKGSPKAWGAAYGWGIMDEVTSHMVSLGDLYNRLVYVYEFPDNHAYVGLTHDKDERDYLHRIKGPIAKHISETGSQPTLKLITADYIDASDAQKMEECTIDLYKQKGWVLLNKAKAGSLGMCKRVWTKDKVQHEANKYKRRIDFQNQSSKAYNAALRNGWLDEVCDHMEKTFIEWTYDKAFEIAKEYGRLTDFQKNSPKAYGAAQRNGWLDQITSHMEKQKEWDDLSLKTEMGKYTSLKDFRTNNNSAYVTAVRILGSNFINNFYGSTPKIKWTPDLLKQEASKYKSRLDFLRGSESAYKAAERQGILQDLIKNLEPDFKWTPDLVKKEGQKYSSRMEFKKNNSTAYKYAVKWGLLDDILPFRPKNESQ
jgi:predicted GIY-YIG superfamily endonuclease